MAEQPTTLATAGGTLDSSASSIPQPHDFQPGPAVQLHNIDGEKESIESISGVHNVTSPSSGPPSSSSEQPQHQAHRVGSDSYAHPVTTNAAAAAEATEARGNSFPASSSLGVPTGGGGSTPFDGRHSPRPASRNQHRHQHHHGNFEPGRSLVDGRVQLFVGNLPFRVRWQDLKDLFRKCGSVLRSDVALTLDNRSKGFGTVLYSNEQDAAKAIETFNGYTWQSRVLDVRVDQQDPTGSISLANAAAQQAQQHAYQTHQQAMQNMANMVGIAQAHNVAAAAAFFQQSQGGHGQQQQQLPMFGNNPAQGASPWMAAAALNGNFNPTLGAPGQGFPSMGVGQLAPQGPGGSGQYPYVGRTTSPFNGNQLGVNMANLSLRRHSSSAEASTKHSSPAGQRSESVQGGYGSPSTAPSSRPGTSPASPVIAGGGSGSKASSPPPHGLGEHRDSISPTSARRPPPGNLGPMPPSIFAGMSQNTQLPNPPAAAAAAVAAGYSIDKENTQDMRHGASPYGSIPSNEGGSASRRGSSTLVDPSTHPGAHLRQQFQQQQQGQHDDTNQLNFQQQPHNLQMQAPVPLPGGLVNFYTQHRGGSQYGSPFQSSPGPPGAGPVLRNAPSPAYANRHLFVGNIPFNCQWQDLKDLFRAAGQILRADVSLGPDGRSRGFGTVLFATPEDAVNAVQMFNGYEFQGRTLKVHFDKFAVGGTPSAFNQPQQQQQQSSFGAFQQQSAVGVPHPHFPQSIGMQGSPQGRYGQISETASGQGMFGHSSGNDYTGRDFLQAGSGFDDGASIPGTPIHELNLAQIAAFPSPGFASPVQQQVSGQPAELRGRGINADGVPVAPIGSGAPGHGHPGSHAHQQQGQAIPLSPLTIPPMSMMSMPSPGPGGMFSPPLPGMGPMMTPSMPGFSFHPFPQTPPLLPQFLSPGLGPFSPPLAGSTGAFFGPNGPSNLRNAAPGDFESTPLHSPVAGQYAQQQSNYFPVMTSQQYAQARDNKEAAGESAAEQSAPSAAADDTSAEEDAQAVTPKQSERPQLESVIDAERLPSNAADSLSVPVTARRASFKDVKSTSLLGVPSNTNRGGSLDIPRPNMQIGEITTEMKNGSAVADEEAGSPPASTSTGPESDSGQSTSQAKKSPWNLSWLKK